MVEVDVRGLSCPIPVVKTKETIEENPKEKIVVVVDSAVSRENVARLAQSKGYSVETEGSGEVVRLHLNPPRE